MSLRKNVTANFLGQGWSALMNIAFVPLYIKYLGIEAYGLIGVFAILQTWLTLLDMGMTPTINREMARYTAGAHSAVSIRDLLFSLEVVCFVVSVTVWVIVCFLSDWLSENWLISGSLAKTEVSKAISIMGAVVALRFIESLYRGALLGLQKQVWLSFVVSLLATLRGVGAILVLILVIPTIEMFFLWQGFVSIITILIFYYMVHRDMPEINHAPKFSLIQLREIWKFASGMIAITFLSLLLMQVDKVILSAMLSLEMFGYYTLAGTVAAVLYQLSTPITQAYYPKLTQHVTKNDQEELIKTYHQGAQLISLLVIPATLMLTFFGDSILSIWTDNPLIVENVASLLLLLSIGTLLNVLMHIPYMLILANGWVTFSIRQNIIAVIILVPATLWLTPHYGAVGAAWVWLLLNAGYVLIGVHFMFNRLIRDEKLSWYVQDILIPGLASSSVAILCLSVEPNTDSKLFTLMWLLASLALITLSGWMALKTYRIYKNTKQVRK